MKKTILSLLLMTITIGAFAQMQVWSNGTIIFSHNTNDVDSISFAGAPMQVQTNTQTTTSTSSSLKGRTYVSQFATTFNGILIFIDDNQVIYRTNMGYANSRNTQSTPSAQPYDGTLTLLTYTYDSNTSALTLSNGFAGYLVDEGCFIKKTYSEPSGQYTIYYDREYSFIRVK